MKIVALIPLTLLASGCLDSGGEQRGSGTNLALEIAPLRLDGIGMACYDVLVQNQPGDTVWARGLPATPKQSGDTGTLCSDVFGNGPGGDIAYVGPCDASQPNHNVTVFVDSLWSSDPVPVPLTDWVNPCPYATEGTSGCTLAFVCQENEDVSVTFNLVVMREANQGFFDVAVNFDDVFCSAKLDCSYDGMGQNAINLLFHDGDRAQTAVAALACTAGPNDNDETLLHVAHARFRCGPSKVGIEPFVCYGGTNRTNERIYGMGATVGSGNMNMTGLVWSYSAAGNGGNGAYSSVPFDPTLYGTPVSASGNYTTAWNLLNLPLALGTERTALCALVKLGDNHPEWMPYPIERADVGVCTQNIASGNWTVEPLSLPAAWLYGGLALSDGNLTRPDFIVKPDAFGDGDEGAVQQAAVFRYWGDNGTNGMGAEDWDTAVQLPLPEGGQGCELMEQFNRTLVGFCDNGTAWSPHIWHISDPGSGDVPVLLDNPGDCSGAGTTLCNVDDDCPGIETCVGASPLTHTDMNFTAYFSRNEGAYAYRTMATIQTLGGQNVPIFTSNYQRSGSPTTGQRTIEYRRNGTTGAWNPAPPTLAAAGGNIYSDPLFEVVRGENTATAAGVVSIDPAGPNPPFNSQAFFKYNGSAWDVYWGGVAIAGEGTFTAMGGQQALPNGLVVGNYVPCTGPCPDARWVPFVGVLPANPLDPIQATRLPVPLGYDSQPLDATGLQYSYIQRRSGDYGITARAYLHRAPPGVPGNFEDLPDATLRWDVNENGASAPTVIGGYVLDATGTSVFLPPPEGAVVSSDPAVGPDTPQLGRDSRWDGERHDCQSSAFTAARFQGPVGSEHSRAYAFDITGTPGNVTTSPTGWELQWPASLTTAANNTFERILDLALAKGNVWSPEHATDPLWQYALYYGNEQLSCGGVSCNKRYFNIALGFDADESNCWVHWDATASQNATDWGTNNGTVPVTPPASSYPVIKYAVPLTGKVDGLACTQNPLNGNNSLVNMEYTGFNEQQPFCFSYQGTAVVNHCSGFSNETLYEAYSDDPFNLPGGGDGGGGGGGGGP